MYIHIRTPFIHWNIYNLDLYDMGFMLHNGYSRLHKVWYMVPSQQIDIFHLKQLRPDGVYTLWIHTLMICLWTVVDGILHDIIKVNNDNNYVTSKPALRKLCRKIWCRSRIWQGTFSSLVKRSIFSYAFISLTCVYTYECNEIFHYFTPWADVRLTWKIAFITRVGGNIIISFYTNLGDRIISTNIW